MSNQESLTEMTQVNHKIPKWAKEMVRVLSASRDISEQQWWDEAFRQKLDTDFSDVEAIFGLAENFVKEARRQSEFNPSRS